jgi:hypothetical protein
MPSWTRKAALANLIIVAATAYAVAEMLDHSRMHEQMSRGAQDQQQMQHVPNGGTMHGQMPQGHSQAMMMGAETGNQPIMPGQDAFGTIQEIVRILEANPTTDWTKVNIGALREHLIDMNEVTLRATASERTLDNGVEIAVTGEGRTLDAIKRMVPAHVHELSELGWDAKTDDLPNGIKLIVTSPDVKQVAKLKALGFMGIMVQGSHHQAHHLMMANGEFTH